MFEWDEAKRLSTLQERGLDFIDAVAIFDGRPVIHAVAKNSEEERIVSVAVIKNKCFAVVWTWRGKVRRIICFRRARDGEEKKYHALYN